MAPARPPRQPAHPDEPASSRLKFASEGTTYVRTLAINVVVLGSLLAVLFVTSREALNDSIVIEEIGMPAHLEEMGYSGKVAAHRLWDAVNAVNATIALNQRTPLLAESRQLEITEPETGLSLRGLAQMIRALLGLNQRRIAGEFVCRAQPCNVEALALRLRILTGEGMPIVSAGPLNAAGTEEEIDEYFLQSALEMLRVVDPMVAAEYLFSVERFADARDIAERTVGVGGEDSAWAATMLGQLDNREERFAEAQDWYDRALELGSTPDPAQDAIVHVFLGQSLDAEGRPGQAWKQYLAATERAKWATILDPEDSDAYNTWAYALFSLARYPEAEAKFRAALKLKPDFTYALSGLGRSLVEQGDLATATEYFNLASNIDEGYAEPYSGLAEGLLRQGAGDAERREADELFEKAIAIDPLYASNRIYALVRADRSDDAGQLAGALLLQRPTPLWAQRAAAFVLTGTRRQPNDLYIYARMTMANPRDAYARYMWGASLLWIQRYHSAAIAFGKALSADPDLPLVYPTVLEEWAFAVDGALLDARVPRCRSARLLVPSFQTSARRAGRADLAKDFAWVLAACTA